MLLLVVVVLEESSGDVDAVMVAHAAPRGRWRDMAGETARGEPWRWPALGLWGWGWRWWWWWRGRGRLLLMAGGLIFGPRDPLEGNVDVDVDVGCCCVVDMVRRRRAEGALDTVDSDT